MIEIRRKFRMSKGFKTVDPLDGYVFTPESNAHRFIVECVDLVDGQETVVPFEAGSTVHARFLKADHVTELVDGSLDTDGAAVVTLPAECYAVPGRFLLTILVTTGSTKICVFAGAGTVLEADSTDVNISSNTARSVDQKIAEIDNATDAAEAAVSQVNSAISAGSAKITEINQAAAAARASIPQDYTALSDSVGDLKSALYDIHREEIATYFGADFLELGGYNINSGAFNTTGKMFRTGYNNLPFGLQRITSKTSKILILAYDKYGNYQGHSTDSGYELSKSTTEPTKKEIQVAKFMQLYPEYRFRLLGISVPFRDITINDAITDLTFYVGRTDDTLQWHDGFADAKAVKDTFINSSFYKRTISSTDLIRGSINSYANYTTSTTRLVVANPVYLPKGSIIRFNPGSNAARISIDYWSITGKYKSATGWRNSKTSFTIDSDCLGLFVFSGSSGAEEIDVTDYDATTEICSSLYNESINSISEKLDATVFAKAQKNWSALFPANQLVTYTVENGRFSENPSNDCWVKFYPYVLRRCVGSDKTLQWSDLMSALPNETFETSPNGVTNCLKISDGKVLVYDLSDYTFKIVGYIDLYNRYPDCIIFAQAWYGIVRRGVIFDGYNSQFVRMANDKFDEYASLSTYAVPKNILDNIKSVNNTITYNYANTTKIGWITDTHTGGNGKNKPLDYCTELTKYGQILAYMITGDLNYYINEQTLVGTQEMMGTVARHIAEMIPYSQPLPCRGNHDGINGSAEYTTEMFNNALLKQYIKNYGSDGQYYYDVGGKIRIIMLNSCIDSQSRKGFSLAQVEWLIETLAATPTGYAVIVAAHHPINPDYAGSVPSDNLPSYYTNVVSAIQNFKETRTDCDFIAYLFGHVHIDNLGVKDGFIQCSLMDSSTDQSDFSSDILCIDTTDKIVHLIRLGEGADRAFGYGQNNLGPII